MAFKLFYKGVKMIIKIFASIGVISIFIVAVAIIAVLVTYVKDAAEKLRYRKRLKNRFEGGPTAKCFCKDCKYYYEKIKDTKHDSSTGECEAHNWWGVRDNCYCWAATPLDYDETKSR